MWMDPNFDPMAPLGQATASPTDGRVYDPGDFYDEALNPDGRPRATYSRVLATLGRDLAGACASVDRSLEETGAVFGSGAQQTFFGLDPVPRIVGREEWDALESALAQRARALNAFIADVYGPGSIVAAGVVPARVASEADFHEPELVGAPVSSAPATVIGFDLVRGADGRMLVLEDNLRTPSGLAYAFAARRATDACLGDAFEESRRSLAPTHEWIGAALRAAAPDGRGDPTIVLLSDGPANVAWYEHVWLAEQLGIPVALPSQIEARSGRLRYRPEDGRVRQVDVVYRRTNEDRLRDEQGAATWVAEALLEPLLAGTLGIANSFGAGVGDDKLTHAYVEEMVRFYLGEEPEIESVPTYDLALESVREGAFERLGELVIKPRSGSGGIGIVIGSEASAGDLREARRLIDESPESFVAQEIVSLSRCPTVCEGRLEPRHVDLRAFAICSMDQTCVVPGGLTRVAHERGSMVVNSSRGGGGKDTWVLE